MPNFIKQTGGEFPLFRSVIAISIVDDLVQVQVTGIVPDDEKWTISATGSVHDVRVYDPSGLSSIKLGGVELTYYNGINICGLPAVSADRLGGLYWPAVFTEAAAFLVDHVDRRINA